MTSAYLVHRIAGRYRLRIPSRRRDLQFFEELARQLSAHDKTERVSVNPHTAGVLIEHTKLELSELEAFAEEHDLFRLKSGDMPLTPVFDSAVSRVRALDGQLAAASGQQLDLRGAVFVILILFGIRELMRGNLMAPATSLFWYAYNTLQSGPIKPE